MHILSLKLKEDIYRDTDKVAKKIKLSRNAYINEALRMYNAFNNRRITKAKLIRESALVSSESLSVLQEFEQLVDEHQN